MSYKNIMVCLDNSRYSTPRLEFAIAMAIKHGAHLTGLYLSQSPTVFIPYEGGVAMFVEDAENQMAAAREQVKQIFDPLVQKAGISFNWLAFDDRDLDEAIAHTHLTDLLIAGQRDLDDEGTFVLDGFPENILLNSGKPMLFLPYTYGYPQPHALDTIIIAWDGHREAARAVTDALPLLTEAKKVLVLSIHEKTQNETNVPHPDIVAYLSRHKVNVEVIQSKNLQEDVGKCILAEAINLKADLMVMGAYGHSQLVELVLGGVTRTLLRDMSIVPILMSH